MCDIPDPNAVFPNEYKTSCFLKNVITAPNIHVGTTPITTTWNTPRSFSSVTSSSTTPRLGTS